VDKFVFAAGRNEIITISEMLHDHEYIIDKCYSSLKIPVSSCNFPKSADDTFLFVMMSVFVSILGVSAWDTLTARASLP